MDNNTEKIKINNVDPPRRSTKEEIANSVSHGLGAVFAIVAFILVIVKKNGESGLFPHAVYFAAMLSTFTVSCLYHAFSYGSGIKRLFRRFDYATIYLLIGGTYLPILLNVIGGTFGVVFAIAQWAIIIVGIVLISVFGPVRVKVIHMVLCVTLGWSGLLFAFKILAIEPVCFYYVLVGGVVYSLGIIPFAIKKKASHFLWHIFVLGGAVVQWIGLYLYC